MSIPCRLLLTYFTGIFPLLKKIFAPFCMVALNVDDLVVGGFKSLDDYTS